MIRRVWAVRLVCPSCDAEHFAEFDKQPEVVEPERMGMGALCGSCEARRRCYLVDDGKPRPFWSVDDEAKAWVNLRRFPDRYRMQIWETDPHDRMLRDDREDDILRLIAFPSRKRGHLPRWKFRWSREDLAVRGIDWPIPDNPAPF